MQRNFNMARWSVGRRTRYHRFRDSKDVANVWWPRFSLSLGGDGPQKIRRGWARFGKDQMTIAVMTSTGVVKRFRWVSCCKVTKKTFIV